MIRLCATLLWLALESLVGLIADGARVWLMVKPFQKFKAWRGKRKLSKTNWATHHLDEVAEDFNSDEVSMSNALLTQIALGVLRHAMTSLAPLGIIVSDDWLLQTAGIAVGGAGILWSAARKWKRG